MKQGRLPASGGRLTVALIVLLSLVAAGCSTVTDAVMSGTERAVGRAVSERAEQAVYARLAPSGQLPAFGGPQWNLFMVAQAQVVFAYSFAAGGYWVGQNEFVPGEYTVFEWNDGEGAVELEKALLRIEDDGREWWRVSWSEEEESWVYEGLLDPEEERIVRLRARDAEGNVDEVPVGEDQAVFTSPTDLTEESIEGATERTETLTTPAGTYETRVVEYRSQSEPGTITWWITESVPGGVVKYEARDEGEGLWTSTLIRTGSDATTELDSF